MLTSDVAAIALGVVACFVLVRALLRVAPAGACARCWYDLRGLPGGSEGCPECGHRCGTRRSPLGRVGVLNWGSIVLLLLIAGGVTLWPRRDDVLNAMPAGVLLAIERVGNGRALEILAERVERRELSTRAAASFYERASDRLIHGQVASTNAGYKVFEALLTDALRGDADARAGVIRLVRCAPVAARQEVAVAIGAVRRKLNVELMRGMTFDGGGVAFLKTPAGKTLVGSLLDPMWLADEMLGGFDRATTEEEANQTLAAMTMIYHGPLTGEEAVARLECRPWSAARAGAEAWVGELYEKYCEGPR